MFYVRNVIQKTDFSVKTKRQQKFYNHLFIAIFGRDSERNKKWRLNLYNALNAEGARDARLETARNALNMNLTIEQAAQISGLTQEEVAT